MKNIAIFGAAGAIGHSIAAELDRRGLPFRAVGRNRERLAREYPKADCVAADLMDSEAAEWAASSVDTIFYTVGVSSYTDFPKHLTAMRATIEAAVKAGVERILVVSSVYGYGSPLTPKVAETHPREPAARKGKIRKEQEDIAMEAHRAGRIHAAVVHLPDFYGPYAELSLAHQVFGPALAGKRATWLGSVDLPHEFIYVPDAGAPLVELASREAAWGERWNLGGAGTILARDFITRIYQEVGRKPRWMAASKMMLWLMSPFNSLMRELIEMQYLVETPVILDDSKLERLLGGLYKTPYEAGIRSTIEWMRR
ncbi:MAG: NAD(P)H-binding protein [Acidobacteria bacterium]|nr:NAD(P)H-binding protein [Acidobacteriota bacterium]